MLKWVMGVFLIIVTLDDYEKYTLSNLIDIREVSIALSDATILWQQFPNFIALSLIVKNKNL